MSKHFPPVPPAGRSDKGSGYPSKAGNTSADSMPGNRAVPQNLAEQNRQGDIKQNTTHKGYQQDR